MPKSKKSMSLNLQVLKSLQESEAAKVHGGRQLTGGGSTDGKPPTQC